MAEIIVKNVARSLPLASAAERWLFVWTPRGFVAQSHFDPNKLTPAERSEYDALPDEPEGAEECFSAQPFGPKLTWPTLELAEAWADVVDATDAIGWELSAFNAPSECSDIAYREVRACRRELLALAVCGAEPLLED